jgi:hypothetical protein
MKRSAMRMNAKPLTNTVPQGHKEAKAFIQRTSKTSNWMISLLTSSKTQVARSEAHKDKASTSSSTLAGMGEMTLMALIHSFVPPLGTAVGVAALCLG